MSTSTAAFVRSKRTGGPQAAGPPPPGMVKT